MRAVAAPAKLTVVAVALSRAKVVDPVVKLVVTIGEVRVLLVRVSVPAKVANVPVVGSVIPVVPETVSVVA